MKALTSFTKITTGEGVRIAYTYSVIDDTTGEVISQNNKGNFVLIDPTIKAKVSDIDTFITEHYLEE